MAEFLSDIPTEIERKFLIQQLPTNLHLPPPLEITQGYITKGHIPEVRLRKVALVHLPTTYFLTIKGEGSLERPESEIALNEEQFIALWPTVEGRTIEKIRYVIACAGTKKGIAELDFFTGHLSGHKTVEVEFGSVGQSEAFEPLSWWGKEVTGLEDYKNSSLAMKGLRNV